MKKIFFTLVIACVVCGIAFAEEPRRNFVDFDKLKAGDDGDNVETTIDLSDFATYRVSDGSDFTLKTSLALDKWRIILASSARTPTNQNLSMARSVVTEVPTDLAVKSSPLVSRSVLGVRIHFPKDAINSYADIEPPFEIPVWGGTASDVTAFQNPGFGVIMNMGILKEVSVRVCGRNFAHRLQVLIDLGDGIKILDMGPLDFIGWKDLKWTNPNYIADIRDRVQNTDPFYPTRFPYARFDGFRIVKDINYTGGDFVVYFDSVSAIYDLARPVKSGDTIDDETVWGIEQALHDAVGSSNFENIGKLETLKYFEELRIDQSASPSENSEPPVSGNVDVENNTSVE